MKHLVIVVVLVANVALVGILLCAQLHKKKKYKLDVFIVFVLMCSHIFILIILDMSFLLAKKKKKKNHDDLHSQNYKILKMIILPSTHIAPIVSIVLCFQDHNKRPNKPFAHLFTKRKTNRQSNKEILPSLF